MEAELDPVQRRLDPSEDLLRPAELHLERVDGRRGPQRVDPHVDLSVPETESHHGRLVRWQTGETRGDGPSHQPIDGPPEGPRPELRVVADVDQVLEDAGVRFEGHLASRQTVARQQLLQLHVGQAPDILAREATEGHDAIDPVEELGTEEPFRGPQIDGVRRGRLVSESRGATDLVGSQVRGEDDERTGRVGRSPPGVGEPPVFEQLQEEIEDVGMGFLDLVEEQHAERTVLELGRQRPVGPSPAPDEACDGIRPHVFVHVEAQQLVRVAVEPPVEHLGRLGLADSGGTQEEERAQGPSGIPQPTLRDQDRVDEGLDRPGLTEELGRDPLLQVGANQGSRTEDLRIEPPPLLDLGPNVSSLEDVPPLRADPLCRPLQQSDRFPRKGSAGAVPPLVVDRLHESLHVDRLEPKTVLQPTPDLGEDLEDFPFGGLLDPEDVKEIGEPAVALLQNGEGLWSRLRDEPEVPPLQPGAQNVAHRQVGMRGPAGLEEPQDVVDHENVSASADLTEHGHPALLPLTEVRHPGDQSLRRDHPGQMPGPSSTPGAFDPSGRSIPEESRLPDQPGAEERDGAPIRCRQESIERFGFPTPPHDARIHGSDFPLQAAADLLQLARPVETVEPTEERHQVDRLRCPGRIFRRPNPHFDLGDPGTILPVRGNGQRLFVLLELAEPALEELGHPLLQIGAALDGEPEVGESRDHGDATPLPVEGDDEEAQAQTRSPELHADADLVLLEVRRDQSDGELVVPVGALEVAQLSATGRSPPQERPIEVGRSLDRSRTEKRPDPIEAVLRLDDDGHRDLHSASDSPCRAQCRTRFDTSFSTSFSQAPRRP